MQKPTSHHLVSSKAAAAAIKQLAPVRDPSRLVKVDFEVRYEECDLAPKHLESHPVLQLYLGTQFVRDSDSGGVVNISLNEDLVGAASPIYKGSLVGTLRREHGAALPLAAPIGMCSYAVHRNDIGTPCYVDVGTSFALLGDVVAECKQRGHYAHSHEMLMRNVAVTGEEPLKKGVVALRVTAVQLGIAVKLPSQLPAIGTQALVLERIAATQAREQTVMDYVRATMEHEQRFPDTWSNIGRVRVPMDISETGIMSTGRSFMPIAAYAMVETPKSNPDFFVNAFQRVMARANLKVSAYASFDLKQKARFMAKIIAYPIQSLDYIGDAHYSGSGRTARKMINARAAKGGTTFSADDAPVHVPEENMSNALIAACGDCEDLNTGAASILHALVAAQFDPANPKHAPLIEMQAIAAQYIPMSSLAVVHGAKIGDEEGYGAHMYLPLMPRKQFMDGLARTKDGRALLERMQPVKTLPPSVLVSAVATQRPPAFGHLPPLFIEGTGIIDPLGYHDDILEQRRYIAGCMPSLRGHKLMIPHDEQAPSNFYVGITNGLTDHLVKREGLLVAGFIFGQTHPEHEMTRGIAFEDVLRSSDKLAIAPQPFIPQQVMGLINDANALRPPIPDQVLDFSKPLAGPERDPHLDRLVAGIQAFKREPPKVPPAESVDVILRPHQYGAVKIAQILGDAAKCERLYDASYEVEHVTNRSYTYRLRLWVK